MLAGTTSSHAEEVEKKWRLGFSLGGYNSSNSVPSGAGNIRTLYLPNGEIDAFIQDPRNDSGSTATFGIESQWGGTLSASYGFSRLWYIEASVGYRQGTVGNVMAQVQFVGAPPIANQDFNFDIFNYDGGTMEQVPLELTLGIRFRPKAAFNPYLCVGAGYTFNSYSPSDDLNQLSLNLDQSAGGFARLSGTAGSETLNPATTLSNLTGFKIDVPDAPEWHFGGGFEYTVHSKWALYLDARYYTYSGDFGMTVNGSSELGVTVPNDQIYITDPQVLQQFGAVQITSGGRDRRRVVRSQRSCRPPGLLCGAQQSQLLVHGPPRRNPGSRHVLHPGREGSV
jgi:outer membrane protein W